MNNKKTMAFVYTLLHFLVDFTTVFLISGILLGPRVGIVNRGYVIIVYNIIAFAGQLPIGIISDFINKNRIIVALGCIMAAVAYPVSFVLPWTACILAALGNGAFHIGAGSDILKMCMPKAGLSGLFVSSGALGVWLAYKAGGDIIIWLCPAIMLIAAVCLIFLIKHEDQIEIPTQIKYDKIKPVILVAVACFMLTIVIRSLLGMAMDFSWKSVPALSFLFVVAVAGGKAMGGFLGDRLGYIKTAVVSLAISLVSSVFAFDYWAMGIIAVLCFNMTMPLTLTAIASVCNKKYGFAFGLTTFALAIGFIPVVLGANDWFGIPLFAGGVAASLLLLVVGYVILEKHEDEE